MSMLNYDKGPRTLEDLLHTTTYETTSDYEDPDVCDMFRAVKNSMVDVNPGRITKSIQGSEQDYIAFMKQAKNFLETAYPDAPEVMVKRVLTMIKDCVFGYYVLTPLVNSNEVSDIKVTAWNHIDVKAKGRRYVSNLAFIDEKDYIDWFNRILSIQHLHKDKGNALQHATDRKGVKDFYLRIDVQLQYITSSEVPNIHIRKIPKTKLSWKYLMDNGMLDEDILEYLKDRSSNGYSFLISGRGGSGKSTLLNNLLDIIPFDESVLVSQESDELYSEVHPHVQFEHTAEFFEDEKEINYELEDELRLGLLQDIDDFVIGEIKGGEALHVFVTAMSTGARFMGTTHSDSAAGSVVRLVSLARLVSNYTTETLEEMLSNIPFVLIHMSHFSIDEILEITGWDTTLNRLNFKIVYKKMRQ